MGGSHKRIGIVFALAEERLGLLRVLADSRVPTRVRGGRIRWYSGSTEIVSVVSGVGRQRCLDVTAGLAREGVDAIICAGFAGGLAPRLSVGDVIVAESVLSTTDTNRARVRCDPSLTYAALTPKAQGYVVHYGDLASSEFVACSVAEKRAIGETTGALAVDMESAAAGDVCTRYRIPFLAVRSVTDAVRDALPPDVASLAESNHPILAAAMRPRLWPSLLRLRGQSRRAAGNLGDALGLMMIRLAKF